MDIYSSNWNEVDDSNSTPAPDGAPEGMPPGGLNDTIRAMMGAQKRLLNQLIPKATDGAGTSTAYVLTYGVSPTALADGMIFMVSFDKACGNAPTLNVNLLGAKSLCKYSGGSWVDLVAGDLLAAQTVQVAYDDTSGKFRILSQIVTIPAGSTVGFRGTSDQIPAGWLIEDGSSIGDASSGGTGLASTASEALFKLLWANSNYSLQDSSGSSTTKGASADADWTAHKRLVLTDMTDKVRRGTADDAANTGGSDTHSHSVSTSVSVSVSVAGTTDGNNTWFTLGSLNGGSANTFPSQNHTHNFSASGSGSGSGSGTAASTSNVPAYVYELSIIKL